MFVDYGSLKVSLIVQNWDFCNDGEYVSWAVAFFIFLMVGIIIHGRTNNTYVYPYHIAEETFKHQAG